MRARLLVLVAMLLTAVGAAWWILRRGDDRPTDGPPNAREPVEGRPPETPRTAPTLASQGPVAPRAPAGNLAAVGTGSVVVRVVDLQDTPVTTPVDVQVGEGRSGGHHKSAPDEGNAYRFEGVAPGEWRVTVWSPAFLQATTKVLVEAGATRETTVRLDPGAAVEGVVVDEEGRPVPGAIVAVGLVAQNERGEATDILVQSRESAADAGGRFAVRGLVAGESFVTARGPFGKDYLRWKTLRWLRTPIPVAGLRLVVARLGTASLRVLTPDGKPFSGTAGVSLQQSGALSGAGREVQEGLVRWEGLAPGTIDVEVVVDGFAPLRRRFEGRLGADLDLGDATVDPGVEIRGRVTDLAGSPLAGAYVSSTASAGTVETEADGTFRIEHALAGPARLSASADGFLSEGKAIDVTRTPTPVEVRLGRGARLRLLVKDAAGTPKGDLPLVAIRLGEDDQPEADGYRTWETTDAAGIGRFQLAPGRWRISWRLPSEEQIPFGTWTLAEGQVLDLPLSLPK